MGEWEAIAMIVTMSSFSAVAAIGIIFHQVRKIAEAKASRTGDPEEVNALRHEVAHLREMMSDVLLQLEYQKNQPPTEISERLTPPEFKNRA